jgi:hypothetical protein
MPSQPSTLFVRQRSGQNRTIQSESSVSQAFSTPFQKSTFVLTLSIVAYQDAAVDPWLSTDLILHASRASHRKSARSTTHDAPL